MNAVTPVRQARISPWVGVRPFMESDADRFFGRSAEIDRLVQIWLDHRLTILHGDSGVGKTSLLRAGVMPRLTARGTHVLPVGTIAYRPGIPAPVMTAENPYSSAVLKSWRSADGSERVGGLGIADFLRHEKRPHHSHPPEPMLLALDELHLALGGTADQEGSRRFFRELAEAIIGVPAAHLLLSVRTADLDALRPFLDLFDEPRIAWFPLQPLGRDGTIDALTRALTAFGVEFEPGVPSGLADRLAATSGTLPVEGIDTAGAAGAAENPAGLIEPVPLQIVAAALWDGLSNDDVIISEQMTPDVELAIGAYCARVIETVTTDHDLPVCEVGSWLRRVFMTPEGTSRTVPLSERPAEITDSVLRTLEDRYLLASVRTADGVHLRLRYPQLVPALRRLNEVRLPARRLAPPEWIEAAELAMSNGELRQAARCAREAARGTGREHRRIRAHAQLLLGDIAYARGLVESAEQHYRTAAEEFQALEDPLQVGRALAAVGRLRLARGDRLGALEELNVAARRAPDEPSVQIGLARTFWYLDRHRPALSALDKVLREGASVEAVRLRGEMAADLGKPEDALRDLAQVDAGAPPSARAARALAMSTATGGRTIPDDLAEIIAAAPENGPVLLRAARIRALCGDPHEAAALASRAMQATNPPLAPLQLRQAGELLPEP